MSSASAARFARSQLTSRLVQLHARYYGKGPTRAKTHICGDILICILGDPFTAAERTLIDSGEAETVQRIRDGLRKATETKAKAIVEESCGREVIACLGAVHPDSDLSVRVFVLRSLH